MDETGIRGASQEPRGWMTWDPDGGAAIERTADIARQVARIRAEIEAILQDPVPPLPGQGRLDRRPRPDPQDRAAAPAGGRHRS